MSFTATRNLGADLTIPLTIPFTVSGTAVFGPDYSCTGADTFSVSSGQLTIPIGSSSATIVVTATPTTVAGLSKSITLTPVAVENKWAIITSSLPWTGTILNLNPASPSLSIINNGTINYSITSDVSSTNPIIINFLRRVTNGSNPAVITSGTVTLPAGATIVNLARVDLSGTSTETVVLQAGSQLSYILSTSTTATINAVTVGVALPTISISLNASAGWVITRTGSTVNSLTVNYSRNVAPISETQTVNTGVVVIIAGATSINVPITTSSLDRTETLAVIAEATYLLGTSTSLSITLTSPSVSVSSLVNNTGWAIAISPTASTNTVVNIRQVVTAGSNLPTTTNSTVTIPANTSVINVLATTATTARTEALTILTGTGYRIDTPTATLTYSAVLPKATVAVSNDGTGFSINLALAQLNATTVNLNRTYTHAGIQDPSTAITVVIPAGSTTIYRSIDPVNTADTTGSVSLAIAAGLSYSTNVGGSNLGILATVPLPNSQLPIVTVSALADNSGWKFTLSSVQAAARTVNYTLSVTPTSGSPTVTYGSMTINAGALTANVLVSNSTGSRVEALTLALGNSYLPTAPNYVLQTVSIAIGSIAPPAALAGDPLFSNVKALLSFNGDITDRSTAAHAFAMDGGVASYSNSNPFGESTGTSISLNGNTAIKGTSSDFVIPASSDFCLEGWVQYTTAPNNVGSYHTPVQEYLFGLDSEALSAGFSAYNNLNTWYFNVNFAGVGTNATVPIPIVGTWYFWQVQRSAGTLDMWINNIKVRTAAGLNGAFGNQGELRIGDIISGGFDTNYGTIGNLSEVRLTVGATRPTVVPTARFPRSAAPIASTPVASTAPDSTTLTGVPSAYSTSLWVAGSSATANTTNQITQIVNSNSNAVTKAVTAPANLSTSLIKLFDLTVNANVLAQNTTNNGYLIVDSKASPIQWLAMVLINDLPNDNTVAQCIFGSSNSYPWLPAAGTPMYSNVGGAEAQNGAQVYINGSSMGIGGTAVIKPPTWTIQYWDMANNTTAAFDYIGGRDRDDQYSISYWHGKFAEIIVGTALLPVADRNKIEGYLAWKYQLNANLPAGHPYKNSAP